MSQFTDEVERQFHAMKQMMKDNKPSKDDKIPTGVLNRNMILMKHQMVLQQSSSIDKTPFLSLQTNSDPISCEHLCILQEKQLKTQMISELKVNQINKNRKLIVTVITGCIQRVAISLIIKDENQDLITLSIYNLAPLRSTKNELSEILPIGTKLIIKEPYAKKATDGSYNIRIDNPHCNLIVIKPNDPYHIQIRDKNPEKLKNAGNDYFKKKMYDFAIRYYSEALQNVQDNTLKLKLLSNRSLCYLKTSKPSKAAQDGHNALKIDAESIKIRYRYATALTNIRKHSEALSIISYVDVVKIASKSIQKDFETLKDRIYRRFLESEEFHQWFSAEQIETMSWKELEDIEDYFSSSIKMKYINNVKGRGVVAKKNIKKDEIILSEKCITFGDIDPDKMSVVIDHRINECLKPSTVNLIQNIVDIYRNGRDIDKYKISLLYHGQKYSKKNIIVPKIGLFKTNEFELKDEDIPMINIEAIREIATKNIFAMPTNKEAQKRYMETIKMNANDANQIRQWKIGSGLFIAASFFNHSGNANVEYHIDYRRIHMIATQDIKKGEELCIIYTTGSTKSWIQ